MTHTKNSLWPDSVSILGCTLQQRLPPIWGTMKPIIHLKSAKKKNGEKRKGKHPQKVHARSLELSHTCSHQNASSLSHTHTSVLAQIKSACHRGTTVCPYQLNTEQDEGIEKRHETQLHVESLWGSTCWGEKRGKKKEASLLSSNSSLPLLPSATTKKTSGTHIRSGC